MSVDTPLVPPLQPNETPFSDISCFACLKTTFDKIRLHKLCGLKSYKNKIPEAVKSVFQLFDSDFTSRYENLIDLDAGLCQTCFRKFENAHNFFDTLIPCTESFLSQNFLLPVPITPAAAAQAKVKVTLFNDINRKQFKSGINRHADQLKKMSAQLFNSPKLSDLTIILSEKQLYGHKFVMLSKNKKWGDTDLYETNKLDLRDIKQDDVVIAMIKWVYTDTITEHDDDDVDFLINLHKLAVKYELESLSLQCQRAAMSHITINNCLKFLKLSEDVKAKSIKSFCIKMMKAYDMKLSVILVDNPTNSRILSKVKSANSGAFSLSDVVASANAESLKKNKSSTNIGELDDKSDAEDRQEKEANIKSKEICLLNKKESIGKVIAATSDENKKKICKDLSDDINNQDSGSEDLNSNESSQTEKETNNKSNKTGNKDIGDGDKESMKPLTADDIKRDKHHTDVDEDDDNNDDGGDNNDDDDNDDDESKDEYSLQNEHNYNRMTMTKSTKETKPVIASTLVMDGCAEAMKELKVTLEMLKHQISIRYPNFAHEEPFKCEICDETFFYKYQLEKHAKIHFGEDPFKCSFCQKEFRTLSRLEIHCRIHTGEKPFACDQCDSKFLYKHHLKLHRNTKHLHLTVMCEICGKSFGSNQRLKRHKRFHLDPKDRPFQCDACGKGFSDASYFKVHQRSHTGERPYQCATCGKSFSHSSAYHHHLKTHLKKAIFGCGICGVSFTDKFQLQKHLISDHTGEDVIKCDVCSLGFVSQRGLETHMKRKHPNEKEIDIQKELEKYQSNFIRKISADGETVKLLCTICQKTFGNAYDMKLHMMQHSGLKPYECDECGSSFVKRYLLAKHKRKHLGIKPFQCEVCGKKFDSESLMKKHHGKIHKDEKQFKCKLCDTLFRYRSDLKSHLQMHSDNQDHLNEKYLVSKSKKDRTPKTSEQLKQYIDSKLVVKTHVCELCGKTYTDRNSLNVHRRIHTNELPYKCDKCGKAFACGANFRRHKVVHTGVRTFKCDICDYACFFASDLVRHKKIHSAERPYKCDRCEKEYKTRSSLQDHIKAHIGIRNFQCDLCEKSFILKTTLVTHRRTHTGEKPYLCSICYKGFSDNRSRKKHEKSVHDVEPPKTIVVPEVYVAPTYTTSQNIAHSQELLPVSSGYTIQYITETLDATNQMEFIQHN